MEEGRNVPHGLARILCPFLELRTCMTAIRSSSVLPGVDVANEPMMAVVHIITPRPISCMRQTKAVSFHHLVVRVDWAKRANMHVVLPYPPIIRPAGRINDHTVDVSVVGWLIVFGGVMARIGASIVSCPSTWIGVAMIHSRPHPLVVKLPRSTP